MLNVATWMREKDEPYFRSAFAPFSQLRLRNASHGEVDFGDIAGLLLTGGRDIAPQFLKQPVADGALIEQEQDPHRDEWEFAAVKAAVQRQLPILAICKGMQLLNVALGGTLRLDIPGHNAPQMKDSDVQPLRHDSRSTHRFDRVNSSHHQAVDRPADGFTVEAWCATDDIIEQMRLRDYPYCFAVQYHPERGEIYGAVFREFIDAVAEHEQA